MSGTSAFPRGERSLSRALDTTIGQAERRRNLASVEWTISHYYLHGHRNFHVANWASGDVQIPFKDKLSELNFRHEQVLVDFRTELGRLMRMDTSPVTVREGYSLDSVRAAGLSQAILTYLHAGLDDKQLLRRFLVVLLKYGTAGLYQYVSDRGRNLRDRMCTVVVPPWQLLPIPYETDTEGDLLGIVWQRPVTMEWLNHFMGSKLKKYDAGQLRIKTQLHGSPPYGYGPTSVEFGGSSYGHGFRGEQGDAHTSQLELEKSEASRSRKKPKPTGGDPRGDKGKHQQQWATLEEIWLFGDGGRDVLDRYIIKVGEAIPVQEFYDEGEYLDDPKVCPLKIGRYTPTGGFYGRSWLGPQISTNDMNERLLATVANQVIDTDQYGILAMPANMGVNMRDLEAARRLKILIYEPDPMTPKLGPTAIAPVIPKDLPIKVADFFVGLQDRMSGQSEILQGGAPGRVDSATGLGFMYEAGNTSLQVTSHEVADVYVGVYRGWLQSVRDLVGEEEGGLKISLPVIDDKMIGISMTSPGELELTKAILPHPLDPKIDIRDRQPVSVQARKQEVWAAVQLGQLSDLELRVINYREGLNLPIGSKTEEEVWRRVTILKLLLYNDGVTPGKGVRVNFVADDMDITLVLVKELMVSTEFMLASDAVRAAFEEWVYALEGGLGTQAPAQLPYPEQLAEMMRGAGPGRGQAGGGGGGGGPPGSQLPGLMG